MWVRVPQVSFSELVGKGMANHINGLKEKKERGDSLQKNVAEEGRLNKKVCVAAPAQLVP